jgi:hypothetical protein
MPNLPCLSADNGKPSQSFLVAISKPLFRRFAAFEMASNNKNIQLKLQAIFRIDITAVENFE